jgi:hypothetical protein
VSDPRPTLLYLAELDRLDGDEAEFVSTSPQTGSREGTLTIRRSDWEAQGRPGRIEVGVTTPRETT